MKNFTKQNFKTNPLWIRLLIMAFMLLAGVSTTWAANNDYYLRGGFNGWNTNNRFDSDGNCTISLSANTTYEFKIAKSDWSKEFTYTSKTITATSTNLTLSTTGSNAKITTKTAGSYVFKFSESAKTLSVTYPASCTTPTITWNNFTENMCLGDQQTLTATASSGATVTFSSGSTNATISGTTLTAAKAGSATITASVAASGNYCSATANKTVTISNCIPVGTILYLKPSTNWASSNARFALYLFKDGGSNTWVDATPVCNNNGYYEITVPDGVWEKMIWCRMNPSGSNGWTQDTQKWNQTGDLTYDSRYNLFTIPASTWDNATTTWSAWTPEPCCTAVAKPTITLVSSPVKCGVNVTAGLITIDDYDDSKYTYTLNKDGNATTIVYNDGYAITEEGSYTVTADVSENSCGAQTSDPQEVTVTDNTPTINSFTVTAASDKVCKGSSVELTATHVNGATYAWYKGDSATPISGATEYIYSPIITENTTFKVVVTKTNNGCPATAEATSTIQVIELPAAPTLNSNTDEVCSGVEFTLPGDYNWYEVSIGGTKLNSATISGGITSNKSYWAEAKNASGCVSSTRTEYTLTVNDKPAVPTLSADKTSLVSPDKATLTAGNTTNGLTYTLYNGETPGESQKSTGGNLTFKVGEAGNYTVRVSNSCGTSTSTVVTITVCTPQTNEFRHANSSYNQLANQPTYYPGDKAYFVSTGNCCLTGTWSANLDKGEESWWTGLTGSTPRFSMTLTRAGEFTITNMATNGCTQDKNVRVDLDFTVTALSQVTNANGTASGADIALTWKHSAIHTKVMVVRYPTAGTETIPAGGQSYSEGNTLGEGTVVYVGTSESYTDKNLPSGESYKYYFYTVNNNYYSDGVVLNMSSCPIPAKPSLSSTAITACNGECTAQGYITINNMNDYKDDTYTFKLGSSVVTPDENGRLGINSTAYTQYTVTVTNSCGNPNSATVDIAINDNKPTITGTNSFQPGGSTTLTSDKGASTTWVALDGGDLNTRTGASVVFTAKENGTYHVQATYNDCSTTITIKVQDDLYVWVRRPIKKEKAYDEFYHEDQNSEKGGDLFYKEFASLPGDYTQYNQGGKAADATCTDKDGYKWYGFVVSKTAIENDYYFTVHAPNDGGKKGDSQKYGGYYTHTYATQLVDMESDLYFVMDESASGLNRGWYINAPVVVRASGDAKFNSNNFADFVPLYVKDANICGKEVVSFEWQKSASENGAYTTYKSGKGINNIRTREAGWYRCVVTYHDASTATSNAIQVTNTTSGTPGTLADFSSKLPVIMVNTNGVGFPSDKNLATKNTKCASGKRYPSLYADDLKEKVTVDVIIKKGNEILYDRKARMNYRGSSSLNFKKKSYAFCSAQDSCVFDKGRHDYVKTKKAKMLNILGLDYAANDKDWVLYAATPDPSMMRNRLVFDLYQQMRPNDWGVHSTYVELIVDGEYRGVYVFMDKITANENRVNITNENGFIVKFDKTDVVDRVEDAEGDQKTFATSRTGTKSNENGIESYGACIDQRFEIEYPEKEDIEDAGGNWEAFYTKVQKRFEDFETALAAQKYDEVRTIIDYDSWADWFIISEFIKNQDGFRASNLFVYNGGKIMAMPLWDQELSMDNRTRIAHGSNSTDGLLTTTASVYSDAFPATFWFTGGGANITGGLLNDPCFVSLVKEKWASYQLGALSASNITTLVNKYHAELDDNIRNREVTKWPYTEASRGTTTDGDYMGYYAEGDANHYNYQTSKQAIIEFAGKRSTELGASTKGLGQALYGLNGKALIFTISPSLIETTPWQPSIFTVNAPEGYVYTLDYSELTEADAIIKENGNVYTFKIPRPNDWGTGGNGEEKSVNYRVTATIDADGENSCGTQHANTATLNVEFSDVTEDCETPIEPQP